MNNLKWCLKQLKGIRLIEPNLNIAKEYLSEAETDFKSIDKNNHKWAIIKEYYACYNALYSLLMKSGIKCEIHDCSIELMELFGFSKYFCNKMIQLKKKRINAQYYLKEIKNDYFEFTKEFLEDCKIKLIELNDLEVEEIRNKIKEFK